jgi:ubiquinone/menaquinone biosynthesis C-methylase UbiE
MNNKEIKKIADFYDKRAKQVDGVAAAGQWGDKNQVSLICEEIGNKIDLNDKQKILEIGCGTGVLGKWLKNHCSSYVGCDISLFMIKKFTEEYQEKVELIQSVTHAIPLKENFFDVVVMNGVSMYLHDENLLNETLREMKRVAKKNGIIFLGENITPEGFYWELTWFQNLSSSEQCIAKIYVNFRRWLAKQNSMFEGKWKLMHKEVSPALIKSYFKDHEVKISEAAARTTRKKQLGKNYKGNRRVDFVIKLKKK